jgi:3-phosphoshikimate 1-carboxyvinyltransferase
VDLPDPYPVTPLEAPPDATVTLPGSKSLTNRALVAAALAAGESRIEGILLADDTEAMIGAIASLGAGVTVDRAANVAVVRGAGGRPRGGTSESPVLIDVRESGTTARFVAPLAALADGPVVVDAAAAMRRRPMASLLIALRRLGVEVRSRGEADSLPVVISGGPIVGGAVDLPGDESSQFLSGLLLAAPSMAEGLRVRLTTPLVSRPYVTMTRAVMSAFGAATSEPTAGELDVASQPYRARSYRVEPDASAASYFFAAAAICGGRVRVDGLGRGSLQGDTAFVDVLEQMGATVFRGEEHIEVRGEGPLHGVDVDLADLSDTAPTLAVAAAFATSPTRVRGVGFIRRKESNRIEAVVAELRRCGIAAEETGDGFVVQPGEPRPAVVQTYGDHRMAMSFAVMGLGVDGIRIAGPGCVAKTFPGFFTALDELRRHGSGGSNVAH